MVTIPPLKKAYLSTVKEGMRLISQENLPRNYYRLDMPLGLDGIIFKTDNKIIICFAGSNELKDWLINLFTWEVDGYHVGFFTSYQGSRRTINEIVKQLSTMGDEEILIGGFSNGAATGYHCGIDYARQDRKVHFFTWGEPKGKTAIRAKEDKLLKTYYRFYHPFDFVTWFPVNLVHSGTPIKITWVGFPHSLSRYLDS